MWSENWFYCSFAVVVPSPPSLTLREEGTTSLSLSWTQPVNDEVDNYDLRWTYLGNCSGFTESMSVTVDGSVRQFVFSGLQEFSTYQLGVTAINSVGRSAESIRVADTRSACKITCIYCHVASQWSVCVSQHPPWVLCLYSCPLLRGASPFAGMVLIVLMRMDL